MKMWPIIMLCALFSQGIMAQSAFNLKNPSFEADAPAPGIVPKGWMNVGAENSSPPDIQPGSFEVSLPAQAGRKYLGLVTRGDNTWEGVGQRLEGFLRRDSTYTFSLWLNRSNSYVSMTKSGQEVNFNKATVLRIWGYNSRTQRDELLAESAPVSHSKWVEYSFVLKPTVDDFDEIDLMAYYAPEMAGKEGNLLLDNCGPIKLVPTVADERGGALEEIPASSDSVIYLANPSFERNRRYASHLGWMCTADYEIDAPIQEPGGYFKQDEYKAAHGRHFMVLLVDDKNHVNAISQTLNGILKKDSIYEVSVCLARAEKYKTTRMATFTYGNYRTPRTPLGQNPIRPPRSFRYGVSTDKVAKWNF